MKDSKKTILVFRTGQLGDTLVAMPAIQAIRNKYPHHSMVLLTDRHPDSNGYVSSWDMLGPTGWFDDVLFYTPAGGPKGMLEVVMSLTGKLRRLSAEYVFNLSHERTPWQNKRDRFFFRHMVGVPNYQGNGAFKCSKNPDGSLPNVEPEWHRLLRIAGGEKGPAFHLPIPDIERKQLRGIVEAEGISTTRKLLAIGPGSKMPAKMWPKERFAELGKRLQQAYQDMELLVLGGKNDKEFGDELCKEWGERSHNLAGRLSIYGSAAILEHCVGFIGNDTGAMHLAGMMGKPCIALFSARNNPGKWEPYGKGHIIFRREIECSGCMLEICKEHQNKCLKIITVDEVFEAVRKKF